MGESIRHKKQVDPMEGRKYDKLKLRWDLYPLEVAEEVVDILTFGAIKYAPDNWKYVENARERYFAALMRHLVAWRKGEKIDPESGKNHLAHAGCCLLFLHYFDIHGYNKEDKDEKGKAKRKTTIQANDTGRGNKVSSR